MKIHKILIYTFALLFCLKVNAETWPSIEVPANTKITIVADEMVINGYPVRTWQIVLPMSITKAKNFYQKLWEKSLLEPLPGFNISENGKWLIISRLVTNYFISVQLEPRGKETTQGYFAIRKIDVDNKSFVMGDGIALPSGSSVVSDISAKDGFKKSQTITAINNKGIRENAQFFRTEYERKGWKELKKGIGENNSAREALLFDKGGSELNIALVREGRATVILLVRVEN